MSKAELLRLLNRRLEEYKKGIIKLISSEDAKNRARKALKKIKKRKR